MTSYTFDQLLDFTRTTSGTFVGSNGLIQTTPASVNLLTFTQEFDNAVWGKSATTVTTNTTTAPDGTSTADTVTETVANNFHAVSAGFTFTNGVTYTISIFAKQGSGTRILQLYPSFSQGGNSGSVFNLVNGTVVTTAGTGSGVGAITNAGNGWYRCSHTFVCQASGTNTIFYGLAQTTANALNFVYTGDGTSGIFLWGAQLELGSTATTYARNNGGRFPARFDYDPATLAPKGILIEEQRANRALQSEDFTVSPWAATVVGTSTRVNDNSALGFMRGLVTATSANGGIRQTFASLTSGQVYALSFYIQSTTTAVSVFMENGTVSFGAPHNVTINPSNGTAGALTGFTSVTITPFSSGYIYTLITAPAGGTLLANFEWRIVANGGSMLYGRPQLEAGAFATSYIPTVASQVTRASDSCAIVAPMFAPWFNASEGTFVADSVVAPNVDGVAGNYYYSASDGTISNMILSAEVNGTVSQVIAGGVTQFNETVGGEPTGALKVALAYQANNTVSSANGAIGTTDTSVTLPTVNRLSIGVRGDLSASTSLNGHIRSVQYYPVRLADFQLQAITA